MLVKKIKHKPLWIVDVDTIAEHRYAEILSNYNRVFTKQSIHLIERLKKILDKGGLLAYKDFESAVLLANKRDDRTRKEFEKWAVLTYSNNQAVINEKKGRGKILMELLLWQITMLIALSEN